MSEVLYLHGFASSPASQKAQFFRQRFASLGVEMAIPDLAEGNFEHLSLSGQLRVAEAAGAGRARIVLGSSMGGYLAALYAARHPEVERVVAMAPAFDFAARWLEWLGEAAMAEWRQSGWLPVFHYGENRQARVGYRLYQDALGFEPFPDVRQPMLILHGRKDDVVPLGLSEDFVRARPNARLVVFDSGHELTDVTESLWVEMRGFCGLGDYRQAF